MSLLAAITLLGLGSSVAQGAIRVYEASETATLLGVVRKGKCKLRRNDRVFRVRAKTTNGAYKLYIDIFAFRGFNRTYAVPFGVLSPEVSFEGVTNPTEFSNVFPFPGGTPPPGGAGQIWLTPGGAKVGLGIYALPNQDYSKGIVLAGTLKCVYPRR